LIVAHGNSLRALVKYLDDIPDDEIVGLNIPTGIPLVYELEDDLKPIRHYYVGDPEDVSRRLKRFPMSSKNRNPLNHTGIPKPDSIKIVHRFVRHEDFRFANEYMKS
jgi:hypothetical protein